ncbi:MULTISPECIES: glycoside hydrolase family 172 protein [Amycolatopsis]|uniref:Fibronectin type-III domain-containing protein n=1 Tax=Amycolatopsis bullii TaxID=941987 RepID=A0ABQ3KS94_9PSEU|nr:DUF2961 domain-containing protein [Amycolatopsis bullii]GHG47900.1 hypothetical protein GCM10017567_83230 [Amycolatopsis bullii]
MVAAAASGIAAASGEGEAYPAAAPGGRYSGWDVYRDIDGLSSLRTGDRAGRFSSFDRSGANDDGFFGTYTCLSESPDGCVIADRTGAGQLTSIWMVGDTPPDEPDPPTGPAGEQPAQQPAEQAARPPNRAVAARVPPPDRYENNTIKIELDGRTVLDARMGDVVSGKLGAPFAWPLVGDSLGTKGGMSIQVPMPYRESMRVTMRNSPLFYHVDYRDFDDAAQVRTFDPADPAGDVLQRLRRFGFDDPKPPAPGATTTTRTADVPSGRATEPVRLTGSGRITRLRVALPQVVPASAGHEDGRTLGAGGESSFRVTVDPRNQGVRLTRKIDPAETGPPPQVFVDGKRANATAQPAGEAGFESLQVPAELTAGKASLAITTKADAKSTEFRYDVHSLVDGSYTRTDTLDVGHWHEAEERAHGYTNRGEVWHGLRELRIPVPEAAAERSRALLTGARLRISFDGRTTVDAPIGEFFGSGLGAFDTRSLLYAMDPSPGGWYTAWWPMPFAGHAEVELVNDSGVPITGAKVEVTSAPDGSVAGKLAAQSTGYFHATHGKSGKLPDGTDVPLLDARGRGTFYGVTDTMRGAPGGLNKLEFLEGDERAYVDGRATPALHGTGTEDFYGGGWYFLGITMPGSTPTAALSGFSEEADGCVSLCVGATKLLLADAIPFDGSLRFSAERGSVNTDPVEHSWTSYWYGQEKTGLRETDVVDPADVASRTAHGYRAGGETVSALDSTVEGVDYRAKLRRPTTSATGTVAFTVRTAPNGRGALLRRLADQQLAGQEAAVFVDGKAAGTWRQPLHDTTSRWLEDEFPLPAALIGNKRELTVELRPKAGAPAWSASQYRLLTRVEPFADTTRPAAPASVRATADRTDAVNVAWEPARDDGTIAQYEVYAARTPEVALTTANLVGTTVGRSFQHRGAGPGAQWYYRVRAVDGGGNASEASAAVAGTAGRQYEIEAEALASAAQANVPLYVPLSPIMSDTAYVLVAADHPGDGFTASVTVPRDGVYALSAFWSASPERGLGVIEIDATAVGAPFDTYRPGDEEVVRNDRGAVRLTAGRHELAVRTAGKNAASAALVLGLDELVLTLA